MYRNKYLKYKIKFLNLQKQVNESNLILENKNKFSSIDISPCSHKQLGGAEPSVGVLCKSAAYSQELVSSPELIQGSRIKSYFSKIDELNSFITENIQNYNYIYISFGSSYFPDPKNLPSEFQAIPVFFNRDKGLFKNGSSKILNILVDNDYLNGKSIAKINERLASSYDQDLIYCQLNMNLLKNHEFLYILKQRLIELQFDFTHGLMICNYIKYRHYTEFEKCFEEKVSEAIFNILKQNTDVSQVYYDWCGFEYDKVITIYEIPYTVHKYIVKHENYKEYKSIMNMFALNSYYLRIRHKSRVDRFFSIIHSIDNLDIVKDDFTFGKE